MLEREGRLGRCTHETRRWMDSTVKSSYATRNWWRTRDAVDRKQKRQCRDGRHGVVTSSGQLSNAPPRREGGEHAVRTFFETREQTWQIGANVRARRTRAMRIAESAIKREWEKFARGCATGVAHEAPPLSQSWEWSARDLMVRQKSWGSVSLARRDNTLTLAALSANCVPIPSSKRVYIRSVRVRATSAALGAAGCSESSANPLKFKPLSPHAVSHGFDSVALSRLVRVLSCTTQYARDHKTFILL